MAAEVIGAPAAVTEAWRFCVAPMMDWTDRHCRYFHRQLSSRARLYTEMVTTGALLHGDAARHLHFDAAEHPVALQLGGSEPDELARAARLGERAGYDEINLNCGCPSERVQRGAFGACLMAEPDLVAACIRAMQDAVAVPVTVKHRIGIDRGEDYGLGPRLRRHAARCRLPRVHRARPQRLASRTEPEGKPRGAAAALRGRASTEARLCRSGLRAQRRTAVARRCADASPWIRRRNARACRLSRSVPADRSRCALLSATRGRASHAKASSSGCRVISSASSRRARRRATSCATCWDCSRGCAARATGGGC